MAENQNTQGPINNTAIRTIASYAQRARQRIKIRSSQSPKQITIVPSWTKYHTCLVFCVPLLISGVGFISPHIGFTAAWILSMLLLALFITVMGEGIVGLKRGALIDEQNTISLARLQLALWTVLLLAALVTAAFLNVARGDHQPTAIQIPPQLWVLMGISSASLVGSGLIKSAKKDGSADPAEEQRAIATIRKTQGVDSRADGKILAKCSPADANWYDLFMGDEVGNGSHLDIGKVQMFIFTWILLIAYGASLSSVFHGQAVIHAFPDLDKSMVALLGISHAGYLANKAVPHSKDSSQS
jgi:hypothetical protein